MRKGNSVERAVGRSVVVGREGSGEPTSSQQGNSRMGTARQEVAVNRPRRNDNPPPGRPSGPLANEVYGYVVSIRETFGFLQPYLSEEQVFFALRDGYRDVAIGDEISFVTKMTPKGLQAEYIRKIQAEFKSSTSGVGGVVFREADPYRGTPGLVKLEFPTSTKTGTSTNNTATSAGDAATTNNAVLIPFLPEDSPSLGGGQGQKPASRGDARPRPGILKGDEVEFTLVRIDGTAYARAMLPKVTRTKRDRQLAEQVQMMLAAGSVREQGVVETIRGGEYGFIKPADRPNQIYFKLDDFIDREMRVSEGMEVEFFVIVENSKGKMSDRAVHLQVLPTGTVEFETTVAENVLAMVTAEAKAHPREEPGILRLQQPIVLGPNKPNLTTIELWQRCLPEGLLCKVGDVLKLDVQNYRPEKLFFARSVKVEKFRSLGRETGVVCSVREHFGFVKSNIRDVDIYFRTSEVIDEKGGVLSENQVKEGLEVSFDVTIEDTGGGGRGGDRDRGGERGSGGSSVARLRAVRVNKISSGSENAAAASGSKNGTGTQSTSSIEDAKNVAAATAGVAQVSLLSHTPAIALGAVNVLRTGLKGIVLRDAKRDAPGLIKVSLTAIATAEGVLGNGPHGGVEELERNYPEVVEALREFQTTSELTEVVMESVPSSLRKVYHTILNERFRGIAHESLVSLASPSAHQSQSLSSGSSSGTGGGVAIATRDPGKGRPLKLWKLNEADYAAWLAQSQAHSKGGSNAAGATAASAPAVVEGVAASAGAGAGTSGSAGVSASLGVDASTGRKIVDMREQGGMGANSSGSKHLTSSNANDSHSGADGHNHSGHGHGRDHHHKDKDKDHNHDHHERGGDKHEPEYEDILFHRTDTSDEFGPIAKDLEVLFDLCFDKKSNKKIAKNVRLTDESIPGLQGDSYGLLDVVVSRNGKFGFIRCIPTDEKLFWHSSGAAPGTNQADLSEGREVSFAMRRRGGLRCAVDIKVLEVNALSKETALEETCTGVVVEPGLVVLLDVTHCPLLARKYWDITKIADILHADKKNKRHNSNKKTGGAGSSGGAGEKDFWDRDVKSSQPEGDKHQESSNSAAAAAEDMSSADGGHHTDTDEHEGADAEHSASSHGNGNGNGNGAPHSSSSAVNGGVGDSQHNHNHPHNHHHHHSSLEGAKYLPPLVRNAIPIGRRNIGDGGDSNSGGSGSGIGTSSISIHLVNPGSTSGKSDYGTVEGIKVGDLVTCKVLVNWALQRHPLMVFDVVPTLSPTISTADTTSVEISSSSSSSLGDGSTSSAANSGTNATPAASAAPASVAAVSRMKGFINRAKVRIKGGGSDGAGYELTEITGTATVSSSGVEAPLTQATALAQTTPSASSASSLPPSPPRSPSQSLPASQSMLFFCDCREPKPLADTSRESMQTGDEIEFIGIPALNVAVAAALQPKKKIESGIVFKRNPINAFLKENKVKAGFKGIVMAEGPPDEGKSVGFPAGWRDVTEVATLPWAHLLPHLVPPTQTPAPPLSVAAVEFVPSLVII